MAQLTVAKIPRDEIFVSRRGDDMYIMLPSLQRDVDVLKAVYFSVGTFKVNERELEILMADDSDALDLLDIARIIEQFFDTSIVKGQF